jgi:hypothetical protein
MIPTEIFVQKISIYFSGEKQAGLFISGLGLLAFIVSFFLYKSDSSYKGMIYPLALVGLIQAGVGIAIAVKSEEQGKNLIRQYKLSMQEYKKEERFRMEKVMKSFKVIKLVELFLIIAGVVVSFIFIDNSFYYSIAIGTIAQASATLVFDLIAEQRAWVYIEFVRSL